MPGGGGSAGGKAAEPTSFSVVSRTMYFFPMGTLSVRNELPDSPNVYSWQGASLARDSAVPDTRRPVARLSEPTSSNGPLPSAARASHRP